MSENLTSRSAEASPALSRTIAIFPPGSGLYRYCESGAVTRSSLSVLSMNASVRATVSSLAANDPPLKPAYAWLTSRISVLEMMSQMRSVIEALLTSCESVSGDDTTAHAPK
jgi:hypothetical protein